MNNWHSIALTGSTPPSAPPHRLHSLEFKWLSSWQALHFFLSFWQALHFFLCSPGVLARKAKQNKNSRTSHQDSAIEFASLTTITHWPAHLKNGVCMLGNLNTCRFLPLPGSEAKNSNLMMFYEGKKSMSMISWSRKGTQANWALYYIIYIKYFYFLL